MRMVFLAPSGAGKTSLLVGAFGFLSSRASKSFGLHVEEADLRQNLMDSADALQRGKGKERFDEIKPTQSILHYTSAIEWKRTLDDPAAIRRFPLTIVDVAGGIFSNMDARNTTEDAQKTSAQYRTEIEAATVFVVVAPFDLVYQPANKTNIANDMKLGLREIRSAVFSEYNRRKPALSPDRPMNVVIALTRSDRLENEIKPSERKSEMLRVLVDHAKAFITAAFDGLMRQDNIQFFLVATSLGHDIEGQGEFNPRHVELPFFYGAWRGLLEEADALERKRLANLKSADGQRQEAQSLRQDAGKKDTQSSSLRSAAATARSKRMVNFITGKSKKLEAEADAASSKASKLRSDAAAADGKAAELMAAAEQNGRDRKLAFAMARDLVEHIKTSLSDGCHIIRNGHYMRPRAVSHEDAHTFPLEPGAPIPSADL